MKRLLLLIIVAIPLFGFTANFIYYDYDYGDGDYWYDEYWVDDYYWYDGYWIHAPHGYYSVHYVWWYPWWWDFYWWKARWCHNFYWDFFYAGFYTVWYENGCWWFRPRYGHWVRYRLPHPYYTIVYNARMNGIVLPDKPPREINIAYNENQVMNLSRQQNPELFARVEREHKSGNLEKMRQEYDTNLRQEIARKNEEYRAKNSNNNYTKSPNTSKTITSTPKENTSKSTPSNRYTPSDNQKHNSNSNRQKHTSASSR